VYIATWNPGLDLAWINFRNANTPDKIEGVTSTIVKFVALSDCGILVLFLLRTF
jgi:hypothetical protein